MLRFVVAYLVYWWGATHRYFGHRTGRLNEYEAAERYFSKALEIEETLRMPRLGRGNLRWREFNRPDEAIADFNILLAADGQDQEALFGRAMAWQAKYDFERALADLDAYLRMPQDEAYWDVAVRTATLIRELLAEQEEG
ncbi:MAG TPA: hypothetical protein VLL52_10840 [Anaerolineae bacterium]|nr:hypothetical protein [Anaerolineae bacterium]